MGKGRKKPKHIIPVRGLSPRLERHKIIIKNLDFENINSVLDVGCGFGEFLELLEKYKPNIEKVGIDSDANCLSEAKKHSRAEFMNTDCQHLPFKDNQFDLVCAIDLIEHLENPTRFIKECLRVSSHYGVFVTPNLGRAKRRWAAMMKREIRDVEGHKQGWDYHLFKQVLETNGWRIDKIITRFVDCPLYKYMPKPIARFLSYKVLLKIFPRIGSELFAFCSKKTND